MMLKRCQLMQSLRIYKQSALILVQAIKMPEFVLYPYMGMCSTCIKIKKIEEHIENFFNFVHKMCHEYGINLPSYGTF